MKHIKLKLVTHFTDQVLFVYLKSMFILLTLEHNIIKKHGKQPCKT